MQKKQKKWWQRSLALMLSLVLVVSSFLTVGKPISYAAEEETSSGVYVASEGSDTTGDGTRENPYSTLYRAYDAIADGGTETIYVLDNITLSRKIANTAKFLEISGKKKITITSASGTDTVVIKRDGGGTLFDLIDGQLTLKNIIIDGNKFLNDGRIINVYNSSRLIIEDGAILRNNDNNLTGSAVFIRDPDSVVIMTGGEIIGNKHSPTSGDATGAVVMYNGSFTMSGGLITGNSGGGVHVKGGEFYLSGDADITGNTIGNSERNVYLEGTKLLTLSGDFTGKAGITPLNRMTAGEQFGKANAGDLKGIENLIADNNPLLFADYGENNALIWQSLTVAVTSPTSTVTTGKPIFAGTATPGAKVTVKVGENITLTATADKEGNWSVTPYTEIPDGVYAVEVSASIDNKISTPVTKEITIDTTASVGPAITTSPGDTVAVIVNNKIENGPVVVDAGVTLDSSVLNGYEDNLNGASVAIVNFKKEDKLEFTSVNGITGNFNPATGILTLSGKASIEDYQTVLRSVTFTTTSTDRTDRNITFTLGSALAYSENGHFYEYINKNATITWFDAKKEAEEKNYFGREGYLVTITSENENNFVKDKTLGLGWIGAKDIERNPENNPDPSATYPKKTGDWRWVTGPEGLEEGGGLQFYTGYAQSGSKVKYANWAAGEPNDYNGSGEYVAHIFGPGTDSGRWNDYSPNNAGVKGYVIEYGDMPGDQTFALSASKKIVFVDKTNLKQKIDEETTLTETDYTTDSWSNYQTQLTAAQKVLDDPNATQEEVDQALADLNAAQNALKPVLTTPGLSSLIPSEGTLSPIFSSEVSNYTMNVDFATSQLSFWATASNPGATVTMTVNGQAVTNGTVPLAVGVNTVVITVQDGTGFKQYTITIYRAADSSSGGGGGTWTPDPTPTPTPSETTTKIKVALEIDGDNPLEKTTVEIERTKHANGEITDFVALTEANAKEAVEKAKQIGNNIARIVIPDVNDEVDQVTVEVPKQSLQILRENGLTLEISTENGHIAIPHSSMEGVDNNFYFRLVPVKKESERKAIEERAKVEKVVRETLQSDDVHVIARPMTIETNMPSRPVQVTLPLKGVNVPTAAAERQAFLDQLAVFIEHSDGEKKVVRPEIVTMNDGKLGLRFTVDKFSTFTIIQFEKPEVSKHKAYIKGFPNGTFGPDKNVTRAQVAIMIARLLGYTEDRTVNQAPFKDVAKDHSAAGEIAFVKQQGIMNGDNKGLFHASANITRAEMAAVVANFKQLSVDQGVTITFNDTKGHWAQWIIEANRTAGIINGFEDGSFAPNAPLTRAQAVVMMNRMFERGPLNGVTAPSFPDVKATHWAFKDIEEAANSHSYLVDKEGNEQFTK
ncbi:S-layer homology domain-containing protein [Heyndrickxia oleronia]|uniref:S-layer homology domain-containing protein n=1 Tax=Heyndrickxia oleronia TaxID=38875 RepID=A0AAW6T376_9BACI|nr:S-layer homology domain-containing protein [Heyndrickxia oleronia]MDH5163537.1 S-layer homology domain-containing protein [Heyndrickxia oleronia]